MTKIKFMIGRKMIGGSDRTAFIPDPYYHNSASLTNEHVETCNKELYIKSRINKFHNEPLLCFHIIPFTRVWILLIGICAKYVLRCPLHVESDL